MVFYHSISVSMSKLDVVRVLSYDYFIKINWRFWKQQQQYQSLFLTIRHCFTIDEILKTVA